MKNDLYQQLSGNRLVLAEILYHMPDHPQILQSFIWQEMDIAPEFPRLKKFLEFWNKSLDGKIHSVQIANKQIISATEMRFPSGEWTLQ